MVNFLIEKGSDVDLIDNNGQTPLLYGAKHGRLEICEILIKNGAKVDHQDKKGLSAMAFAKRHHKNAIVDLLVQAGVPAPAEKSKNSKKQVAVVNEDRPKPVNEKMQPKRYRLTILKDGAYLPMSEEELENFLASNPDFSQYFINDQVDEEAVQKHLE